MVHSTLSEIVSPMVHGGYMLDLPFDSDFGPLCSDDDDLSWMSPPSSPERDDSPDLFGSCPLDQVVLSRGTDKVEEMCWDSIFDPLQDEAVRAVKQDGIIDMAAVLDSVMWDGSDSDDSGPPPLRSVWGGSASCSSDAHMQALMDECMSSDDDIGISDGEFVRPKRAKRAQQPAVAAVCAIQAKKAKLAAIRQQSSAPMFSPDTPEGKRHTHNVLERKRREDLKVSYQNLRLQVPELSGAERAPTGQILIKAAEYIARLKAEEQDLAAQLAAARAQNANLRRLQRGVVS